MKMGELPKLQHLPPITFTPDSKLSVENLETVWKIGVCDITWSVALSYLMTVPDDLTDNVLKNVLRSKLSLSENRIKAKVREIRNKIREFNFFRKGDDIQRDIAVNKFMNYFRNFLFSNCNESNWHSILQNVTNYLNCVIYLYSIDSQENCQFFSLLKPKDFHGDCPKLIIFCLSESILKPSMIPKFGFGIPSEYAEYMRRKTFFKVLQNINLSEDDIEEIYETVSFGKNFLICLLQSSCKTFIPILFKPPYIARKLAEIGFAVDPRLTDENGFSAFHFCMDLSETSIIWMLYNFAANMFYLKDHNVRNPNDEALNILTDIKQIIETDIERAQNLSPTYKKTADQILRFNRYQREVVEETLRLKQTKDFFRKKIISILEKYEVYFHFKSDLYNHTLNLNDELGLFQNFVLHNEYHENLDAFTSMVFFDQFPHIIGYMNKTNRHIFNDTLSSIFLSILSNSFFPKYEHKNNSCQCGRQPDICEQENNAQRFIAFYYRQCFLSKAVALAKELKKYIGDPQSSSTDLLETIRNSLTHLPEIEDVVLIFRIKFYLKIATDSSNRDNESTRMLTFERTLQIIGEMLSTKTISKTVIRFLIRCCLPTKLTEEFIKIRHHCLSHYRSSTAQARLNIESKDHIFLDSIHEELHVIDQVTKSVFDSQQFRIEEFLIENCKINAGCMCENIKSKLDKDLSEIIIKRKEIILTQKENFSFLLRALFKYAVEKLQIPEELVYFKDLIEAINYLLKFVATHWEEYSTVLLQIKDKLRIFISSVKSNEMTDQIKSQLNKIFSENSEILDNVLGNFQSCALPVNFPYSTLLAIFSEMKDFDLFTPKEKIELKKQISEFVRKSNDTVQTLIEACSEERGFASPELFEGIIAPENMRSNLSKYFSTIYKLNELHEVFTDTKKISNKTLFKFLGSNLDDYGILSSDEKGKIQGINRCWGDLSRSYSKQSLSKIMNNDSEIFYDQDPEIKKLKDELNIIFTYENKRHLIDKCISKNIKNAKKILNSKQFEQQKLETWYKDPNDDILNLKLVKEEHLSFLLKISLPKKVRHKFIIILNKKMSFLIDRINHMKRLLISEDKTIFSLWESRLWKSNKDEEKHLKSLMIQRYLTEERVKAALEMLLFDCMVILESDDLSDLWKKTSSMFIGSNMRQILAHGNPFIETTGSLLDSTDLPSDYIDKILNLIKDEYTLRMLSEIWLRQKSCKKTYLKEYISKTDDALCTRIKCCSNWEKYLELLPLRN